MKYFFSWCAALTFVALMIGPAPVNAKSTVSIDGISNSQLLYGVKGPSGIDTWAKISKSAGSISNARARAIFKKTKVTIGNEVISAGTAGDVDYTHVRAGSLFFGKAKFIGSYKNQTVSNFKIKYHMEGGLHCYVADEDLGPGYALTSVETQVRFNGANRFVGTATVDGVAGYDGGVEDLEGQLDGDNYDVTIDKDFTVPLGKVKDGKSYPMLFMGATLVSYGSGVPVDYCSADFYNTSDMSVTDETKKKYGSFEFTPAKPVDAYADPQPFSYTTLPDVTIYVETTDEVLLNAIDVNTVQLFERIGDAGSIQPWGGILDTGDFDEDGIPDRGLVFKGIDTDHSALYDILYNPYAAGQTSVDLYVIGETDDGTPFSGKFQFTIEA